ncbi:hypothetical protein UCRNP2_4901 [Neofusicoccum parvum UCRNP2]|uniref:DUF7872 domain-containing protein n=1 Tax=Botryosphaeria parva (strain UCR-NP2) TaxID=1287680 RepID=R1GQU6_BOTPV|nr:hypothetical protein UCRNP2_4901 [Neofusicoccum parvum UCRNP2]
MRSPSLLVAYALSTSVCGLALPLEARQDTDDATCTAEALTPDTWKSLDIDTFMNDWTAYNITPTEKNNIQTLSASFGAPNFFCGLDSFCNAGQPCLPIDLPAWYLMVAIQNWNNYMNSLNTAITFASSIMGLKLPSIVNDFYPKPKDDITPLKNIVRMFSTVLSVVPFTGQVATVASGASSGLSFLSTQMTPPEAPDLYMSWSNVASSLGEVVTQYQASVSDSIQRTIDAQVNTTGGINEIVAGGNFLGVTQNFTQADLQETVLSVIETFSIGLTLQAQKIFIYRDSYSGDTECRTPYLGGWTEYCVMDAGGGGPVYYFLLKSDGDSNAEPQLDAADLMVNKYGLTQSQFMEIPTHCYDQNNKQQLAFPFDNALPLSATTPCVFNLLVCDASDRADINKGIVDWCRNDQGLDI